MIKTRLAIAVLVAAGLAGSTFSAEAKTHHKRHHATSSATTGANMKSSPGMKSGGSSEGNVGPGTNNNQTPPSGK